MMLDCMRPWPEGPSETLKEFEATDSQAALDKASAIVAGGDVGDPEQAPAGRGVMQRQDAAATVMGAVAGRTRGRMPQPH
jgi:hypothetical protein